MKENICKQTGGPLLTEGIRNNFKEIEPPLIVRNRMLHKAVYKERIFYTSIWIENFSRNETWPFLAGYTANSGQIGFLRLFAPHEKSLCPKTKTLAWSKPKIEKWHFYRRFGGIYRQYRANVIFKIICTAWEVIVSKN